MRGIGGGVPGEEPIQRELAIGELISRTINLFAQDFTKYVTVYIVIQALSGVLSTLVMNAIMLPTIQPGATAQQTLDALPGYFGSLFLLLGFTLLISLVLGPLSTGTAIVLASERLRNGQVDLSISLRKVISRLPSIWVLSFILGIIVALGFAALVVPGIILGIMFSLALPVMLIEGAGIGDSMGRSRKLVGEGGSSRSCSTSLQ